MIPVIIGGNHDLYVKSLPTQAMQELPENGWEHPGCTFIASVMSVLRM